MVNFRNVISLSLVMLISLSFIVGVQAYHDNTNDMHEKIASTDKSDRTLIKEIYANQQETLKLLKEIKAMVKVSKEN